MPRHPDRKRVKNMTHYMNRSAKRAIAFCTLITLMISVVTPEYGFRGNVFADVVYEESEPEGDSPVIEPEPEEKEPIIEPEQEPVYEEIEDDSVGEESAVFSVSGFSEFEVNQEEADWERLRRAINEYSAEVITIYPRGSEEAEDLAGGILVIAGESGEANVIYSDGSPITIERDVILAGYDNQEITLVTQNAGDGRHFEVTGTSTFGFSNVIIDGGNLAGGIGIAGTGNLTLNDATIQNCRAVNGGGVENNGALSIVNSKILGNKADNSGDGVYWASGSIDISGDAKIDAITRTDINQVLIITTAGLDSGAHINIDPFIDDELNTRIATMASGSATAEDAGYFRYLGEGFTIAHDGADIVLVEADEGEEQEEEMLPAPPAEFIYDPQPTDIFTSFMLFSTNMVGDETALRNAVANAVNGVQTTITLIADIQLTGSSLRNC